MAAEEWESLRSLMFGGGWPDEHPHPSGWSIPARLWRWMRRIPRGNGVECTLLMEQRFHRLGELAIRTTNADVGCCVLDGASIRPSLC